MSAIVRALAAPLDVAARPRCFDPRALGRRRSWWSAERSRTASWAGGVVRRPPMLRYGPVGPEGPIGPEGPVGPVGPVAPVAPISPVGPVGPVAPVAPVG